MTPKLFNGAVLVESTDNGVVIRCDCCCEDLVIDSAGGDDGYSETFDIQPRSEDYDIGITFTAYTIADSMTLSTNIGELYSSGCIGAEVDQPSSVSETVTMPKEATSVTITVNPLCGPTEEGTAWLLFVTGLCVRRQ